MQADIGAIIGGSFVPETLMANLDELKAAYAVAQDDAAFQAEFHQLLNEYVGRPSPLTFADALDRAFWRRENLSQTRRTESHRRAQNQQRHRANPAGAAEWAKRASLPKRARGNTA